jgi:glycosyltransferase involved in cell wall biosynthesis
MDGTDKEKYTDSQRIFIISGRNCVGDRNGGMGVNYKLWLANREYALCKNMYHVFFDRILSTQRGDVVPTVSVPTIVRKHFTALIGLVGILKKLLQCRQELRRTNHQFIYKNDDYFVFMDFEIAYVFSRMFPQNKFKVIHHNPGTLYYFHTATHGGKVIHPVVKYLYEQMTRRIVSKAESVAFPSFGAAEAFMEGSSVIVREALNSKRKVIHNGLKIPKALVGTNRYDIKQHFGLRAEDNSNLLFVTITRLDESKNVIAIPALISLLKKNLPEYQVFWVLIGDGAQAGEVEKKITSEDIEDSVWWMKSAVPHDEIFGILRQCDFYLMLHKISVFDYATLEAMGCGCVPVLSNVGGNKECNVENNCLLLDGNTDYGSIKELINSNQLSGKKEQNKLVQEKYFGDKSMLSNYLDWIEQ